MDLTAIDRLSEELGRAAHKAGAVFATAESCTGGGIAAAIIFGFLASVFCKPKGE